MTISVSLSGLTWLSPDDKPVFQNLDLTFGPERTGIVGRNGTGKTTLLRLIAGEITPSSGRITIVGSLGIMRQNPIMQPDDTIADLFSATPALELLARAEAGLASAEELAGADWTLPSRIEAALLHYGLSDAAHLPLAQLSGGQRNRAALAALTLDAPDFLLLDEPTNNLDAEGRELLIDLVRGWKGGAIIISHDRELLEHVDAIVELTSLGATRYGGNYSAFVEMQQNRLNAAERDLAHAEKTGKDTARRNQQLAERKARMDGNAQKARAKGGQPKILMDAAKGRAEASTGAGNRLRDNRQQAADHALKAARERIEVLQPLHMEIAPTGLTASKQVLRLENLSGGPDAANPVIRNFDLTVTGPQRIVIAGRNGSGKTTLLGLISGQSPPSSGIRQVMVPFTMLDQHLDMLEAGQSLRENFMRLNPAADQHMAHAALARFGFRAADALRPLAQLSGGERLRAGLACSLGASPPPMLLLLDEPTNHLDLEGIAALEAALGAYDGAILAVSHDTRFIEALKPDRIIRLGP